MLITPNTDLQLVFGIRSLSLETLLTEMNEAMAAEPCIPLSTWSTVEDGCDFFYATMVRTPQYPGHPATEETQAAAGLHADEEAVLDEAMERLTNESP